MGQNHGHQAGPTRNRVPGVEGGAAGTTGDYHRAMFLPVAATNPAPTGNPSRFKFFVTTSLALSITANGANKHTGKLLHDYGDAGPGDHTWCPTREGIVVIRLTS